MTEELPIDWEHVLLTLRRHGMDCVAIARAIYVPEQTVRNWLQIPPQDMRYQRGVRLLALLDSVEARRVSSAHLQEALTHVQGPRSPDSGR